MIIGSNIKLELPSHEYTLHFISIYSQGVTLSFLLFSPSRDGGNFAESIYTNGQEYDNEDDPALLMVGGNRNDGSAIFGFDHVKEFCVRFVQ